MPFATFIKVREVSSEDSVHLADNLIKPKPDKKWKTKNAGEKSAYVILEMSGSYHITGIDIGNEHSAFVEVLVGKSGCASGEFKEILITSSFMTPTESKSSNNINRVRCFNHNALVPSIAENKWSLVKILCTQPFNKYVPYGLSFIKVHINDDTKNSSKAEKNLVPVEVVTKTFQTGNLKFREDSSDSENENDSSLFNRWKKSKHNDREETTASLIRMASANSTTLSTHHVKDNKKSNIPSSFKEDDNILDRNREELLFGNETEGTDNKNQEKLERLSKQIDADKKRRRVEIELENNKKKRKSLDFPPKTLDTSQLNSQLLPIIQKCDRNTPTKIIEKQKKNGKSEDPIKNTMPSRKCKPFNQLLNHVVLVISGIQNPDRANLRSKAIALGAKYKADWDNTCTHLICAFKNTPKYNQVKGSGKIVTRSWIEKCYSSRKYIPWRRYALDSKELAIPESDEEIFDDRNSSEVEEISKSSDLGNTPLEKSKVESAERSETLALYDIEDEKIPNNLAGSQKNSSPSESDTDDEIKRIEKNIKTAKINATPKAKDIYDASTDEEDYIAQKCSQNN